MKKKMAKAKKSSAKPSIVRSVKSREKALFVQHPHLKKLLALFGASSAAAVYILSH